MHTERSGINALDCAVQLLNLHQLSNRLRKAGKSNIQINALSPCNHKFLQGSEPIVTCSINVLFGTSQDLIFS